MQTRFYIPENTPTLAYAREYLLRRGMPICIFFLFNSLFKVRPYN